MKLTELMAYAEAAFDAWGDLDCFMDIEDEDLFEAEELACEIGDDDTKRIVITNYPVSGNHLKLVK